MFLRGCVTSLSFTDYRAERGPGELQGRPNELSAAATLPAADRERNTFTDFCNKSINYSVAEACRIAEEQLS